MKKTIGMTLACVFLIALVTMAWIPTVQASETKRTLNYANFPPAPTFPCIQMERWKKEVEKRTNGMVQINTFPGGTLLNAKNMMDGVIAGQADIGCLCMAYQPGRFLITNATSLPLGTPNSLVGSMVLWDIYKKYNPEAFSKVKVLAMFTTAPSNIMSKIPIRTIDDMKGVDLRASGGAAQLLKAWDANLVAMPMPSVPEALQKGVVKGLFTSVEVMKDFKFAEICKYVTMTDAVVYPFAVVMNMDTWHSLHPKVKAVMEELGPQQAAWTGAYMDNHVEEAIDWSVKNQNVEVINLSADEKVKWDKRLEPITTNWIKDAKAKGVPAEALVQDIRDFIEMYSGK
jgi:TRAP-type C4-dicarboxylate transport system substrate-binding protein